MDGPLFMHERYVSDDDIDDDDDDADSFYSRLEHVLKHDNKDDFVELINSSPCLRGKLWWIHLCMFLWDSADCAAAVLARETKISNVTAWLSEGSSPLHSAAAYSAYRITALLLENGFSADARCHLSLRDELPLGVVLAYLRSNLLMCNFKGRPSAVKLIIELFRKSLIECLETLRLLAQNSREVKNEFFKYLKEGKMVEVGALLLVARSRFLSSSTVKGEHVLGFQSISEMHGFLLDEMFSCIYAKRYLYAGGAGLLHCNNKLIEMEETLLLLKIFDKIGDKLSALIRLDFMQNGITFDSALAAASLIEDAGFDVKAEYLCSDNLIYRLRDVEFRTNVLERGDDECKKTAFTTYAMPSWLKAAACDLAEKSDSSSRLTNPFLLEALPEMNHAKSKH